MRKEQWLVFVIVLALAPQIYAQVDKKSEIEGGANYRTLTSGYPPWAGAYFRFLMKPGSQDTLYFEVVRQREFDDTGTFFSFADSHTINDDWYWFVAAGTSSGGFFFPTFRVDGQLNKKWLPKRKLVTSFGAGYFDSKDTHRDSSFSLAGVYYFDLPVVLQGGVRWNRSTPGSVISRSQFVAVTQGKEGKHFLAVRGDLGREAYQAIGPGSILVDFPSQVVSATWKQWLGDDWGFNSVAEYYHSSVYQRTGVSIGFFKSF